MTSIALPTHEGLDPAISHAVASWRAVCRRHCYIVPSFALVLIVCAWYATWGDWKFFEREVFCGFYDAQARALLQGRLDVPPCAIGIEAFIFRGKTYGYFGIGPALLRLPLVIAFKDMDGRWSRCLMLLACLINLACAYRILLWIRGKEGAFTPTDRLLHSIFILCAGIGSTNVFIVDRCYTYHEAIAWGATFALLFTVAMMKYFRSPDLRVLAAAGAFAFFSFHSRPTDGAGTLLALGVLTAVLLLRAILGNPVAERFVSILSRITAAPAVSSSRFGIRGRFRDIARGNGRDARDTGQDRDRLFGERFLGLPPIDRPLRHAMLAGMAGVLTVAVYFSVNFGKFRTFDGVPVRYYGMYHTDPRRMQVTGGRQIHPENIPTSLATYFGFRGIRLDSSFPWVYLSRRVSIIGHPAIDVVEQYASVPIGMPALSLLALLGLGFIARGESDTLRRLRLPAGALLLGGGIILMTVGITERYLHDLYPFLIVAGAAGVVRVAAGKYVRPRTQLLALLAIVSIVLNCTFALEYQRLAVWGVSQSKRSEMKNVQHAVDRFFHVRPHEVAEE